MRKKKWLKSITAVAMSIVLLVTTVPIVLAVDTTPYNPSPIFSDASREQGAAAWLSDDGNVRVEFPAAEGAPTYQGYKNKTDEKKDIAAYVLELHDLGGKLTAYKSDANPLTISIDAAHAAVSMSMGNTISAMFTKADIEKWIADYNKNADSGVKGIDLTNHRYSITITAVDSDGWLSQEMYTYVSDVPIFSLTDEEMMPMTTHESAMREMMRFEESKTTQTSSGGVGNEIDYQQTGNTISAKGKAEQAGAINADTNITTDTSAYRLLITGKPADEGQSFDTAWSRETWDYEGAKEIWFWMDLSQVDMQGISFRLRSNEKQWRNYGGKDNSTGLKLEDSEADEYGTVYSTLGAVKGGKTPYVYVQQEDGSWKKVNMTNGTIDLAHFKGYVRVPIEFFCSEEDTFVQLTNDDLAKYENFTSGNLIVKIDDTKYEEWANKFYCRDASGNITDVLVDKAGTAISDALLLQRRGTHFHKLTNNNWQNLSWMKDGFARKKNTEEKETTGYMLAPGLSVAAVKAGYDNAADVEKQADGTYAVVNRETGLKAINDVMSAGFAYKGISDDSIDKSIYLDNILFYRTDGLKYPESAIGGEIRTGVPVSTYFNQKEAIQEAVFNAIDKYISTPNYSDYRAVKYVADLINNYKRVYTEAGQYNATNGFLEYVKDRNAAGYGTGPLADAAAKLGRSVTWQKYLDARKACLDEGTIQVVTDSEGNISVKNINNSAVNDLIPEMIKAMEKLPDPETVTQVSQTLRTEIVKLYRIYTKLNLGQLTLLGTEEARLIKYFNLVVNAIQGGFVTGRELANMPFITFNNFEENTKVGNRAYQLENDPNIGGDTDFRNTQGIVTYSIDNGENFTKIANGYNYNPSPEKRPNATWAYVTNQGFKNSKGATVTIDADWTGGTETGTWHTITVTKKSSPATNLADRKTNAYNMSAENLGGMAAESTDKLVGMDAGVMPLSLVFYVDFTNLSNFKFGVNIFSVNGDGDLVKCRPDMGDSNASDANKKLWRAYYMMDPATGEWVRVQNDNQWSFSSNSTDGVGASLDGYKGYIAIPLQHFKRKNADISDLSGKSYQLDYDTSVLNNIFAVQFGIAGDASIDNSTYTIDNVGFTYDKKTYEDRGLTTGQEVTTYAEKFGAKSDTAEDFENAVANIDPYADEAALENAITEAEDIYFGRGEYLNKGLGDYQKTLPSVKQAYNLLISYKDKTFFDNPDHQPSTMTVDTLVAEINALPALAKNASTTRDDLPYPGYTDDGSVDYAKYGFADRAAAEKVIELYEKNYKRMPKATTDTIDPTVKTALLNAYGAARRSLSLEDMKTSATSFLTGLTGLYTEATEDGKQTKYTSVADRNADATKWDEIYNGNMPYFAKAILASGGMGTALQVAQYANLGIPRFLRNCQTTALKLDGITLSDGTSETTGGINKLLTKYTDIYNRAKTKIESEQIFTDAELQEITDAIGEYNSLMQAYHDVVELYNVIEDIKALFPVHNVSVDKETVSYNKDNYNTAQTVTYSVDYTETYPVPTSDSELNKIRITFANGKLTNALNEESEYNLKLTLGDSAPQTFSSGYIRNTLNNVLEISVVKNNAEKQNLKIDMTFPNQPDVANEIKDTLTIELIDKDGNVVQSRSGAADASTGWNALEDVGAKTVTFSYAPDDAYTITIPAEVNVPWNSADAQKVGYKVETSLATGSSIAVSVADDGTNKLKVDGYSYTLPFTPENFAAKTFTGTTSKNMATEADCPKLTISGWESVPIGEYHTNLTYTVDYTKGTATP